jgi:hypothetical protein
MGRMRWDEQMNGRTDTERNGSEGVGVGVGVGVASKAQRAQQASKSPGRQAEQAVGQTSGSLDHVSVDISTGEYSTL